MIKQQILIIGSNVEILKPEDTVSNILDKYGNHYIAFYKTVNVMDVKYRVEGNYLEVYDQYGALRRYYFKQVTVHIDVLDVYEVDSNYDSVTILPEDTESVSILFKNED